MHVEICNQKKRHFLHKHPIELVKISGVWVGLMVAAVGALSGGLTYGTGYNEARSILEGNAHLPWIYAPARALATLAASLSGIFTNEPDLTQLQAIAPDARIFEPAK